MPFLPDHCIGEHAVLPTVVALAWMKQAVEQCYAPWQCVAIEDYRLFKGIVFDGSEPKHCVIELSLVQDQADTLVIAVKVQSENAQAKPVFHYAANWVLQAKKPTAPLFYGQLPDTFSANATRLYQDGTLFHGASLQGIKSLIACDEKALSLACQIDASAIKKAGELNLLQSNIFANDLIYQALLVWVSEQKGLGSLPSSTQSFRTYRELDVTETFYIQLSVQDFSRHQLTANVTVIDQQGVICAEIQGAVVTANERLKALFQSHL